MCGMGCHSQCLCQTKRIIWTPKITEHSGMSTLDMIYSAFFSSYQMHFVHIDMLVVFFHTTKQPGNTRWPVIRKATCVLSVKCNQLLYANATQITLGDMMNWWDCTSCCLYWGDDTFVIKTFTFRAPGWLDWRSARPCAGARSSVQWLWVRFRPAALCCMSFPLSLPFRV